MLKSSSPRPADMRPHAQRYRTVFISDLHLGTPGCKADCLLDFLQHVESEYLYLIGDVVDGWRLKKKRFWPERHSQILRALRARSRRGTRVTYLPGNHDEALRRRIGRGFAGVRVLHDVIHQTADGRRLLVIHGDAFDGVCTDMKWLARLGSIAYDAGPPGQHRLQPAAPLARARLLAPVGVPEGAGQGRGQLRRALRALARRRGAPPVGRGRGLRPRP